MNYIIRKEKCENDVENKVDTRLGCSIFRLLHGVLYIYFLINFKIKLFFYKLNTIF